MALVYIENSRHEAHPGWDVAAGIVVSGEQIWPRAAAEIHALKSRMPPGIRKGIHFRSDLLMTDARYDASWPREQRSELLEQLMQLPRRLGVSIVWSIVPRSPSWPAEGQQPGQILHLQQAIAACIGCVGLLEDLRETGTGAEKIVVHIRAPTRHLVHKTWGTRLDDLAPTALRPGSIMASPHLRTRLERCDTRHLAASLEKRVQFAYRSPPWLLQIPDAVAHGLRRHLEAAATGVERYASLIFGSDLDVPARFPDAPQPLAGMATWAPGS